MSKKRGLGKGSARHMEEAELDLNLAETSLDEFDRQEDCEERFFDLDQAVAEKNRAECHLKSMSKADLESTDGRKVRRQAIHVSNRIVKAQQQFKKCIKR